MALINPEIDAGRPRDGVEDWEGCLSIPDIRGRVPRARQIIVRAYDRTGKKIEMQASGFTARVIQHETDHLDGVLFFDRMKSLRVADLPRRVRALLERPQRPARVMLCFQSIQRPSQSNRLRCSFSTELTEGTESLISSARTHSSRACAAGQARSRIQAASKSSGCLQFSISPDLQRRPHVTQAGARVLSAWTSAIGSCLVRTCCQLSDRVDIRTPTQSLRSRRLRALRDLCVGKTRLRAAGSRRASARPRQSLSLVPWSATSGGGQAQPGVTANRAFTPTSFHPPR